MATSTASLHKNKKSTLGRIKRFLAKDDQFSTSVNQIIMKAHGSLHSQIYSATAPVKLSVCPIHSKNEIQQVMQGSMVLRPAKIGEDFGPTWSTFLFKVEIKIPSEWQGKQIHFRWNSSSEAMLLDSPGNILQGLIPKHREFHQIRSDQASDKRDDMVLYVEMACNGLFGALGDEFSIDPPNPNLKYQLKMAEIAVFEPMIFKLYTDLEVLLGIIEELPEDIRGYQALYMANEMINLIISKELTKASDLASKYFSEGSGSKAHTLVAMGHCHIDTAWLWTYGETRRKCGRSWASQVELMKEYPDIVFTCSQMQQLAWVKEDYPGLFEDIKKLVSLKRFIPVGGTWVEMDGLIPDGESFIRQFFYGQKFMEEEFGMRAKEFWLPDTFGYSGQIPQIMNVMGIKRFLTQKISWNRVNKFPHHSFRWEGIDGSEVIAHFPPGDSYEMSGQIKEIVKSVNNSEDKGRTNVGAYLYGLGDGGGGPTEQIIERLLRVQNVDGLPKITFQGPDYLFNQLESDSGKLCKWVGELYLEMHNGTYTSQARIKRFNRKLERMLKEAEFMLTLRKLKGITVDKPDTAWLDECWKGLLLNQFHDIIPGSCIEAAVKDALQIYEDICLKLSQFLVGESIANKLTLLNQENFSGAFSSGLITFNPLPWAIKSVFAFPYACDETISQNQSQQVKYPDLPLGPSYSSIGQQFTTCCMELQPSGYSKARPVQIKDLASPIEFSKSKDGSSATFSNGIIRLEFSLKGRPSEKLFHGENGSEWEVFRDMHGTSTEPGMFYVYDDNPTCWDAWDCDDYHLETRQTLIDYNDGDMGVIEVVTTGPLIAIYRWKTTATQSKTGRALNISRYTIMKADSPLLEYRVEVDWEGQSHKFLKVEFPANVLSREATYEIQYGHIKRPTHSNTSWDMAQYETSGHKWVDITQTGRGLSLINDSKYGFRIKDNIISLSLLRSPKAPDGNCDMHKHLIRYGILPHNGSFQQAGTIQKAYEFNTDIPFLISEEKNGGSMLPHHVIVTSEKGVIPEVVKLGHDKPNSQMCLRLYECFGGSWSNVQIKMRFPGKEILECNGMEEATSPEKRYEVETLTESLDVAEEPVTFYSFKADFRPFEIKSFLITL